MILATLIFQPIYPPDTMGVLNHVTQRIPWVWPRVTILAFFAWVACARFRRIDIGFWLVAMHVGVMLKSWTPWDKYDLPLLAVLWYLAWKGEPTEAREVSDQDTCGGLAPRNGTSA